MAKARKVKILFLRMMSQRGLQPIKVSEAIRANPNFRELKVSHDLMLEKEIIGITCKV